MGMNYFFQNTEKECDHEEYEDCDFCYKCFNTGKVFEHIGKSSIGWQFSWYSNPELNLCSNIEYRNFLKDKLIYNEEGEKIEYDYLMDLIDTKFNNPQNKNHTIYCRNSPKSWEVSHGVRDCYLDFQGHSFSTTWFR